MRFVISFLCDGRVLHEEHFECDDYAEVAPEISRATRRFQAKHPDLRMENVSITIDNLDLFES